VVAMKDFDNRTRLYSWKDRVPCIFIIKRFAKAALSLKSAPGEACAFHTRDSVQLTRRQL
jgi:hypothetical protein